MKVGDKAPEVLGINEKEKKYALPITKEKSWELCFYPKDNTSGCTHSGVQFKR